LYIEGQEPVQLKSIKLFIVLISRVHSSTTGYEPGSIPALGIYDVAHSNHLIYDLNNVAAMDESDKTIRIQRLKGASNYRI
jgi:hypothetical protein